MFCFSVLFSDYTSIHSASLDEYNKELVPGPWAIRFLPSTLHILSVHNTVIGFCRTKIFQFQIPSQKLTEVQADQVTAVMEYSDKCNRILCAASNKLIWLHVSPDTIKTSPAANLPIDSCIDQLLNLNTQNSLSVLCYSIKEESIAIAINLKSLTVSQLVISIQCKWQTDQFWPEIFAQSKFELYMAGYKKIRVLRNVWSVSEVATVNLTGDRVFRVSEDSFIVTGSGFSYLLKLNEVKFTLVEAKELISKQRTLLVQKVENKILQVTSSCINVLGHKQIVFDDSAMFALAISKFVIVSFVDSISIYKDLAIVKQLCMDDEVLAITEKNKKQVVVAVKNLGLFTICLDELVLTRFEPNCRIFPSFYYWNSELEVFSNSNQTVIFYKGEKGGGGCCELDFGVIRVNLLKESLSSYKFFLQGVDSNYILSVPGFKLISVDFFDSVCLYESTFLGAYPETCKIGPIERTTKTHTVKLSEDLTSLAFHYNGIYTTTNDSVIIYSHQFQELFKIALKNLTTVSFCTFFQDLFVVTSENRAYFLSSPSLSIHQTIQTPDTITSISADRNFLIIYLQYSVLVYKDFTLHSELKILNPDYEEIGKKLDTEDLESIIQLKLSEKFQKIVKFSFVNTGRNHIEKFEMDEKECVCVTDKGIYWGKLEKDFEVLTQKVMTTQKLDFECIGCTITKNEVYTLHYNHFCVFSLEVIDSLMILMNAGHVDWRNYKINLLKKVDTIEGIHLSISQQEATIISASGESQVYDL